MKWKLPTWREIVKMANSAVGRPWVYVNVVPMPDGRTKLELDYNMAFIRFLDKNGFDSYESDELKVDAYLNQVARASFSAISQSNEEGEEEE